MTKLSLSSYLMVSVLFILSGILWVLFTQVDNNYKYSIFTPDLQQEQSDIIQRIYHVESEVSAPQQPLSSVTPEKLQAIREANTRIQPIVNSSTSQSEEMTKTVAAVPSATNNNYNDAWSTFPALDSEASYFLRNNPWSPDYRPGR